MRETLVQENWFMARKEAYGGADHCSSAEVEIAVATASHSTGCREAGITEQTYYRWRKGVRRSDAGPGAAVEGVGARIIVERWRVAYNECVRTRR